MKQRRFGRTGWMVSEIGYGAWQIGGNMWGDVSDERAAAALRAALASGVDFFDTALAYGNDRSEQLVGRALRDARVIDDVRIATKVPPMNREWPARADARLRDVFPARWIRECAERSLRNLKREPIDLLQLHVWADAWTDDNEWLDAMLELREEQKIRAFGVSLNSHEPDSGVRIVESGRIDSVQVIYNVFDPTPAAELFPAAREYDVAVIVRVPLDEGSLAGNLRRETTFAEDDWRATYFTPERLEETVDRVDRLRPILESPDQTLAQAALRFALTPPEVSTVIVGSTNPAHVADNARVSEMGPLDEETLERLKEHAWPRNFYA